MKKKPKVGDRVEFRYRSVKIGKVVAVAETGAHFLIKMSIRSKYRQRQIGINDIIRILPMSFKLTPIEHKPERAPMCARGKE